MENKIDLYGDGTMLITTELWRFAEELDASVRLFNWLRRNNLFNKELAMNFFLSDWNLEAYAKKMGKRTANEFDTKMREIVARERATLSEKHELRWEASTPNCWLGFEDGAIYASVVLHFDDTWGLYLYHSNEYKFDFSSAEEAKAEADRIYDEHMTALEAWLDAESEAIDMTFIKEILGEDVEIAAGLFEDDEEEDW